MLEKILFRCDAGESKGLGHLSRCSTLAQEFVKEKHQVEFLVRTDDLEKVKVFLDKRFDSTEVQLTPLPIDLPVEDEIAKVISTISNCDFLIVDHYFSDLNYQYVLKENHIKWFQFDYLASSQIIADGVINGNISAKADQYKSITNPGAILCIGGKYSLISSSFCSQPLTKGTRFIISMGGGLIPTSIKAVVEQIVKNKGFEFDIFSTDIQWSGQFENQFNVHYHLNANDLNPFLDSGRVALVAGGVTTFEMAAKKIPMLILPFASNQIKNAKAWQEKGFGIYYQSERDLLDEIEQMGLESVVTRSERAFGLREDDIDCLGAKRIYDNVIQHLSK